ncbi:MAG: OBG GTPase family GTP-binding protein, partial [Methermicoccaceae archaeon]
MVSIEERIREIEDEIRKTPYNKATSHHIGRLKAKIARLREENEKRFSQKSSGESYAIRKGGHATAVLVGNPSVGKSTLLNALTGAKSEVAAYEFTTLKVMPGVMHYKGAEIQVLDVPGIIEGAARGRGRGREILSVVRSADIALLMVDAERPQQLDLIYRELHSAGIRLNTKRPNVTITKRPRGGINISSTVNLSLDKSVISAVLHEYRYHNADVLIREDITVDDLVDALSKRTVHLRGIIVFNKIDLCNTRELTKLRQEFPDASFISAEGNIGLEELKEKIYTELGFIRIYLKPQGKEPDMDEPLVVLHGSTVRDVCLKLHRDFIKKFRYAQVWGPSAKHEGQRV